MVRAPNRVLLRGIPHWGWGTLNASLELRTHYLTPTFTKLNLLGLLHTAWESPYIVPVSLEQKGHGFSVEARTTNHQLAARNLFDELLQALNSPAVGETMKLGPLARYEYVNNQIEDIKNHTQEIRNAFQDIIQQEYVHVRKSGEGGSPTLLLAPDLGKYSTATLPYRGIYPDATDYELPEKGSSKKRKKPGISVCTLLALVGFTFCTFRAYFTGRERADRGRGRGGSYSIHCAFLSPFTRLGYSEIRALYWSGRRLSAISSPLFQRVEESPPSTLGLFAALSPVILDASPRGTLQRMEFVTYVLTKEGNKQYVRSMDSLWAGYATRLPEDLVGAMLAELGNIPRLLAQAPDFFNVLGEYLISGDDRIYLEALRELASSIHSLKQKKLTDLSRTASFLLSHAAR